MFAATDPSPGTMLVYIGTYTGAKSKGIYVSRFDPATGRLTAPELAVETPSPSFLALHPGGRFLYAVGETANLGGKRTGAVSAFSLDAKTGKLTLLNRQSSGGAGPCHLAVDQTGKCLLVANYGSGSIAALPIQADGALGEPGAVIQHQGSSVNPQRQAGPHAHFITPDPANRFALACDLGLDQVLVYRLDPAKASLAANDPPFAAVKPGSGPRHLAFHPSGRFVFLINEMGSTLTAFAYDAKRGALKELQTRLDAAGGVHRQQHLRRGAGPSLREVRVWLEPRPRQHRCLWLRPRERQTDLPGAPAHSGQEPAALCHRPDRPMAAGGEPGLGQHRRLPC